MNFKINKPRFDRMKNDQLQDICSNLIGLGDTYDFKALHLESEFGVIQKSQALTKNFIIHSANPLLNEKIDQHRKRLDDLVAGLHLNIKGLAKACFAEDTDVMSHVETSAKYMLGDFTTEPLPMKASKLIKLIRIKQVGHTLHDSYTRLHLMRYIVEIENVYTKLKDLESMRTKEKLKIPKGGGVQSKEAMVFNLKFFMQSVQHAMILHPETDYTHLQGIIWQITTPHNAQVRNLVTRRKNARLKINEAAQVAVDIMQEPDEQLIINN